MNKELKAAIIADIARREPDYGIFRKGPNGKQMVFYRDDIIDAIEKENEFGVFFYKGMLKMTIEMVARGYLSFKE